MRHIIFILALLGLVTLSATAQPETRRLTISGQLLDAEMKEPMVQVTIQLFLASDSKFVGGTISDNKGNFIIEAPSNGTFRLRVSSIGYQTLEREITLRRNQNQDLGNLLMSPESVMLKEAVVTGRAAPVVVRKDTLIYRVSQHLGRHHPQCDQSDSNTRLSL